MVVPRPEMSRLHSRPSGEDLHDLDVLSTPALLNDLSIMAIHRARMHT